MSPVKEENWAASTKRVSLLLCDTGIKGEKSVYISTRYDYITCFISVGICVRIGLDSVTLLTETWCVFVDGFQLEECASITQIRLFEIYLSALCLRWIYIVRAYLNI